MTDGGSSGHKSFLHRSDRLALVKSPSTTSDVKEEPQQVKNDTFLFSYLMKSSLPIVYPLHETDMCDGCGSKRPIFFVGKKFLQPCVLCGKQYCIRCCAFFVLPSRYLLHSVKDGQARVCYNCEVGCRFDEGVEINANMKKGETNSSVAPSVSNSMHSLVISPPKLVSKALYRNCLKCLKRSRQGHNCRLCGQLFCDSCSMMKSNIPEPFCKASNSSNGKQSGGDARICDRCFFLYSKGAKLYDNSEDKTVGVSDVAAEIDKLASALPKQFVGKLRDAACAGCESHFHLLNKKHKCPYCFNLWCGKCIGKHIEKEKVSSVRARSLQLQSDAFSSASSTHLLIRPASISNLAQLNVTRQNRVSLSTRPQNMVGARANIQTNLDALQSISRAHRKRGQEDTTTPDSDEPSTPTAITAQNEKVPEVQDDPSQSASNAYNSSSTEEADETGFEILCRLGEGSYGSVYKAVEKKTGRLVAIKVIEDQQDDDKIAGLMQEINFLEECVDDHIVAYRGTYELMGYKMCIAMEYCCSGSLSDIMEMCDKTFEEKEIAVIMREALLGLDYLHTHNKIHRDIKAGNILLNEFGECKLADFGVSCRVEGPNDRRTTMIGTPYWMAPEVLQTKQNHGYDCKADIWSLGITALELAKGEPPLHHLHPMRVIYKIPFVAAPTLPDPECWSPQFSDFLAQMLRKDPLQRPSAGELLRHPFIISAGTVSILAELVNRVISDIDAFRIKDTAKEDAVEVETLYDILTKRQDQATLQFGTTMLSSEVISPGSYKTYIAGRGESVQYGTCVLSPHSEIPPDHY